MQDMMDNISYVLLSKEQIQSKVQELAKTLSEEYADKNLEKVKSVLKRGEFFSVRNAGHFFQEEKAEVLADMVDKYILYGEDGV